MSDQVLTMAMKDGICLLVAPLKQTPGLQLQGSSNRIGDTCTRHGPKSDHWYGGYEDALFEQQVLRRAANSLSGC